MITDERKGELISMMEYSVNKYLSSQGILNMTIESEATNDEEETFLRCCFSYFSVMLPEGE